ncbi:MAG: hypothetical protein ACJA2Q_000089 [Pseudohongiellaceae bacterium]
MFQHSYQKISSIGNKNGNKHEQKKKQISRRIRRATAKNGLISGAAKVATRL